MAEFHDNTKPASNGTISLSRYGTFNYFPIEPHGRLKPLMALFLHQRLDGELMSSIDTRWLSELGELDE